MVGGIGRRRAGRNMRNEVQGKVDRFSPGDPTSLDFVEGERKRESILRVKNQERDRGSGHMV